MLIAVFPGSLVVFDPTGLAKSNAPLGNGVTPALTAKILLIAPTMSSRDAPPERRMPFENPPLTAGAAQAELEILLTLPFFALTCLFLTVLAETSK